MSTQSTPHELLEAYKTATGLPVSMSHCREMMLTQLVQVGITPEDIHAVAREIKSLIKRKPETYNWTCLEFRNFCEPDKLEERALTLRQKNQRMQPTPKQVPRETVNGFKVLDSPAPKEVQPIDVRSGLIHMANQFPKSA